MKGFSTTQISRLQQANQSQVGGFYSGAPNARLTAVIAQLRLESPELFHSRVSLSGRLFWDQPSTAVPSAGHQVSLKAS